jgi:poly-gamma-glutamate synthesis protein (capsule biosynthesis protein)
MWTRRRFLEVSGAVLAPLARGAASRRATPDVRLFLAGDVMTGRGIDQVLPHPSQPTIYEPYMSSALGYLDLAEQAHGAIPRPASFPYAWGDALPALQERSPDLRIVNLETSVTTSGAAAPKGINYRMHPKNVPCLAAAGLDCCVLSNNHVLDWGEAGLLETMDTLEHAGIATAGAGRNAEAACRPATLAAGASRVLVFGLCSPDSGISEGWAAAAGRPGLHRLPDLSARTADRFAEQVGAWRRPGDRVVVSIHWGGNWGYAVPRDQREFAHRLVDAAAADVVHGHSSHHPKGIEVYGGRLVLYGCGDFIDDYEGISGHEEFRSHLVLGYFAALDAATGRLLALEMAPFRIRRFRLERAAAEEREWLRRTLDRECHALGTALEATADGLALRWA